MLGCVYKLAPELSAGSVGHTWTSGQSGCDLWAWQGMKVFPFPHPTKKKNLLFVPRCHFVELGCLKVPLLYLLPRDWGLAAEMASS